MADTVAGVNGCLAGLVGRRILSLKHADIRKRHHDDWQSTSCPRRSILLGLAKSRIHANASREVAIIAFMQAIDSIVATLSEFTSTLLCQLAYVHITR
jgi:hypothetical protein